MNYWNKEKKSTTSIGSVKPVGQELKQGKKPSQEQERKKKTGQQTGRFVNGKKTNNRVSKTKKIKKSLQYLMLLKKFDNVIDFKNIKLLRAFLTKFGKIRPRRKTRLPIHTHRLIAKAIRKARAFELIPFTFDVQI